MPNCHSEIIMCFVIVAEEVKDLIWWGHWQKRLETVTLHDAYHTKSSINAVVIPITLILIFYWLTSQLEVNKWTLSAMLLLIHPHDVIMQENSTAW